MGLALVVVSACGGSGATEAGDDSDATTTSLLAVAAPDEPAEPEPAGSAPDPSSSVDQGIDPAVEAEILAAVQGYWDTLVEARNPPDPSHPGFDRYFTGEALEHSRARTERMAILGHEVHGAPIIDLTQARIDLGDRRQALVQHCMIDAAIVSEATSGVVVSDEALSGFVELTVTLADGRWQVAATDAVGVEKGRSACG